MRQSDAALTTIRSTLDGWDRQEYFESLEQYKRFKQIRNRIVDARTRTWAEHPPWVKEDTETYNGIHEKDGKAVPYVHRVSVYQPYPHEGSNGSRH
jgi:hypothetical protein